MNLTQKIIGSHLVSGTMTPGSEIGLRIDQTLTQDATGTMAWLQFEALGIPRVKTDISLSYVDHNTLQMNFRNPDDHRFLRTVAAKFGGVYSGPGTGICHQLHLENFAKPGATLVGSDSHTPTAGGICSLAMGAGGLSHRLLSLADEIVGGTYGGIGLTAIVTCMFFGAISGSGPATVAAIGALTIPAMVERGYDKYFSAALVAAAGCVGVMIPPSNPFVVYGISAQVSIGDLFMSGIVPGIMVGIVLMTYCYWYSRKKGWRGQEKVRNARTLMHAAWDAKWALMVPVIVLGGIYGGIMTPTEAAAIAAFYGLIVGLFLYKEMDFKCLINSCIESCETSAVIIVLMAMATLFGNIMTIEDVPGTVARAILSFSENKIVILMLINVLLLIVGTFMEALAAIVILVPILLPIVTGVGVSPLHFGVIIVVNLAIGFITPPVGVNLFVASGVAKAKLENIAGQALPMIALMLIVLLICTYIPEVPLILVGGPH